MYPQLKATFNFRKPKRSGSKENTNMNGVVEDSSLTSSSIASTGSSGSDSSTGSLSITRENNKNHETRKSAFSFILKGGGGGGGGAASTEVPKSKKKIAGSLSPAQSTSSSSSINIEQSLTSSSTCSSTKTGTRPKMGDSSRVKKVVIAMHDFTPVNSDTDLPLIRTQEYEVLNERIDGCTGWWRVRNRTGDIGLIPSNYVQEKVSPPLSSSLPSTPSSSSSVPISSKIKGPKPSSTSSSGASSLTTTSSPPVTSSQHKKLLSLSAVLGTKKSSTKHISNLNLNHASLSTTPSSTVTSSKVTSSLSMNSINTSPHHLIQCHWFQPDMDRISTESLLRSDGREGVFLVRFSASQELFTISVLVRKHLSTCDEVKHYLIRKSSEGPPSYFLSENRRFNSIEELIQFHRIEAGSLAVRLKHIPPQTLSKSKLINFTEMAKVHGKSHQKSLSKLYGDKSWEIGVNELSLMEELGSGQFGVVRRGKLTRVIEVEGRKKSVSLDVAVKLMKEGTMSESDFVREAKVMTKLRHPNLVQLFGLCIEHRPICIVTEFMKYGSLLSFLRSRQNHLRQHPVQLLEMCLQICEGMAYLEAKNYIHRDLAARNCLVGEGQVVKVADFGLTRFVADSNEYTSSSGTKFPIKWAPPEVLWFTKFSSKSDVWAFGVLMWEVFTCGQMPYGRSSNAQVVELIREGERLERPRLCSRDIYQLMEICWHERPEKRPSFSQLNNRLKQLLE